MRFESVENVAKTPSVANAIERMFCGCVLCFDSCLKTVWSLFFPRERKRSPLAVVALEEEEGGEKREKVGRKRETLKRT